jgi:hypothetical protein
VPITPGEGVVRDIIGPGTLQEEYSEEVVYATDAFRIGGFDPFGLQCREGIPCSK